MSEIEEAEGNRDTFWGNTLGFVAGVAMAPVGVVKGAINAAEGGSFGDGFNETVEASFEKVKEFGDRHDGVITGGVVAGLTGAIATMLGGRSHK